jgi:hypothetical protein
MNSPKKTGRPSKPPELRQSALAACHLTPTEYGVLTAAAHARGVTTSELIRRALAPVLSTQPSGVVEPSAAAA